MRIRTIVAFGAGYALGAKAGRERYEQLTRWFEAVVDSPVGTAIADQTRGLVESSFMAARHATADGLAAASDRLRALAG